MLFDGEPTIKILQYQSYPNCVKALKLLIKFKTLKQLQKLLRVFGINS